MCLITTVTHRPPGQGVRGQLPAPSRGTWRWTVRKSHIDFCAIVKAVCKECGQGPLTQMDTECSPLVLKVLEMNSLLKTEETLPGNIDYLWGQKLFCSCP